jgi:hypothetical protein
MLSFAVGKQNCLFTGRHQVSDALPYALIASVERHGIDSRP